ncbi:hypothetical protein ACFZDK_44520 [Streptomyces sp. NPDC007901]
MRPLPKWLPRLLPDIDVEGEKLSRKVPAPTASTASASEAPRTAEPAATH